MGLGRESEGRVCLRMPSTTPGRDLVGRARLGELQRDSHAGGIRRWVAKMGGPAAKMGSPEGIRGPLELQHG